MTNRIKIIHIFLLLLFALQLSAESVTVDDYRVEADGKVYRVPETGSNISVFLLENLSGAKIYYRSMASQPVQHQWFRYHTAVDYDKEPVAANQEPGSSESWVVPESGYAYYEKSSSHYIWIIDYSQHPSVFNIPGIVYDPEIKCTDVLLKLDMAVPEFSYHLSSGGKKEVNRNFKVTYQTQKWDESRKDYVIPPEDEEVSVGALATEVQLTAPLTNTYFTFHTDEIARYFGAPPILVTQEEYTAVAVEGRIVAEQIERDNEDGGGGGGGGLGGSAPVEIEFTGYGTDAVSEYLWKVYKKDEYPDKYMARGDGENYSYTFNYFGDYYVELEVRNQDISCTRKPDPVPVNITESSLKVPNAFSPGTTPGKNDIFKVSSQSIIKFEGAIFSRWGVKVFEWNSPDGGWDGKYKGSYVPAGVYYYIIRAEGSDGIKYNKQGDINLLRPKDVDDKIKEEPLR